MSEAGPDPFSAHESRPPSFEAGRRFRFGFSVLIGTVSATLVVILLNYLAARHLRWRRDLTAVDRFSLSPLTHQLLPLLTNDVEVTVLFDRDSGLFSHVDGLLKQYALVQPFLHVAVIDPVTMPDPAFKVRVRYKLAAETENVVIFDDRMHPPIVISDGELSVYDADAKGMMAGRTPEIRRAGFKGELRFTSALNALIESAPARVAFLTGHNEYQPDNDRNLAGYRRFAELVTAKNATTEVLRLDGTNELPVNLHLLIVAGGTEAYTEVEVAKLERFLTRGGRLLWLLDPAAVQRTLGPETILLTWGIGLPARFAGDPTTTRTSLDVLAANLGNHPIMLPLRRNQSRILFPSPRVVRRLPADDLPTDAPKVEILVSTSTNGLTKSDFTTGYTFRPGVDIKDTEVPLAVAAERGGVAGVTAGRANGRVVVIGDVNSFVNEVLQGYANYQFAELTVAWLLDQTQLLTIGPKPIREYRLELSLRQTNLMRWILLGALPGGVLGLGILVWFRRRS